MTRSLDAGRSGAGGSGAIGDREVQTIILRGSFKPVFQPIFELETGAVVAYEALSRFPGLRAADVFAAAAAAGLRRELEEATLRASVAAALSLPASVRLHLNVSAELVLSHEPLAGLLRDHGWMVVLELTEDIAITDYAAFRAAVAAFGPNVSVAVDDAGAGYASLRHLLELSPRYVKLDRALIAGIAGNTPRQALVAGLSYYALRTGAVLIAEAIEGAGAVRTLMDLGVSLGQGFYLTRPAPAEAFARTAPRAPLPLGGSTGARARPARRLEASARIELAPNIGPNLARGLRAIGIETFGDLVAAGALAAWRHLQKSDPALATSLALLALEAATQEMRTSLLTARERGELGVIARVEGRARPRKRDGA